MRCKKSESLNSAAKCKRRENLASFLLCFKTGAKRFQNAQFVTLQMILPQNNVFGIVAGKYKPASTDGYYLLYAPLGSGEHTLHIMAKGFLEVTYQLTVK